MQNLIIKNTSLAEINMGSSFAAGQQYKFPDVPQLRDVITTGIICHALNVDYNVSTAGNAIVNAAKLQQSILFLYVKGVQVVYQLPCYSLVPSVNGGFIRMFGKLEIDIPKSYVQLTGASGFSTNDTYAFTFIYEEKPNK